MEYGTTGHHYKSVGERKNCLINDAGTFDNTREEKNWNTINKISIGSDK